MKKKLKNMLGKKFDESRRKVVKYSAYSLNLIKGTVDVISSDPLFKVGHV